MNQGTEPAVTGTAGSDSSMHECTQQPSHSLCLLLESCLQPTTLLRYVCKAGPLPQPLQAGCAQLAKALWGVCYPCQNVLEEQPVCSDLLALPAARVIQVEEGGACSSRRLDYRVIRMSVELAAFLLDACIGMIPGSFAPQLLLTALLSGCEQSSCAAVCLDDPSSI